MLDLLLVATMVIVCTGIGLPLVGLLPQRFTWRVLVAPAFGSAVLAVAVPVAYRCGVRIPILFWLTLAVAFVAIAVRLRTLDRKALRLVLIAAACWLGCVIVLLAPRWVGGDQFSVFQGNPFDTYGYLQSAMVYARKSYAFTTQVTDYQMLHNPLLPSATSELQARPSAHLLYAMFSRLAPGQAYRLYYPYLVFFFSQFALVAAFAVRSVLPKAKPIVCIAIALVFPLGFWGQYVLDIDAWSQIAATPLMFLLFGLVIHAAVSPTDHVRFAIAIAVVVAGLVYFYPEGFIIYAAALIPIAVAVPVLRMIRTRRMNLRSLVPVLGFGGITAVALYPALYHFVIQQVVWSHGTKISWWEYFQAFMQGRDGEWGSGLARDVDFGGGLFGLYFATPTDPHGVVLRLAIAATVIALISALVTSLVAAARETRVLVATWAAAAGLLLAPAAYLAYAANYWPAGKIVSYASPVVMTLLCLPIGVTFARPALRAVRWIVIAFVAFQLALGLARIPAARSSDRGHYALPYPATVTPEIKHDFGWDFTGLEPVLTRQTRVLIEPMDVWMETGLMVFLFSREIPFAKVSPYISNFGSGRNFGSYPPPWSPDVELSIDKQAFVLHFADGRPDLRVVSGNDLR